MGESTNPRRGMNEYKPVGEAPKRPNGPQWGESAPDSVHKRLTELRDVEDVVVTLTPGVARNVLLADLRRLRDDVMDGLVSDE